MAAIPPTPVPLPVLEYGTPDTAREPTPAPLARAGHILISFIAAASVFLPFTFATAPWEVLREWNGSRLGNELLLIAWPFVLGIAALAWDVRQLLRPGVGSRIERAALYLLGAAAILTTFFVWLRAVLTESPSTTEMFQLTGGPAVATCGILLVLACLRRGWRGHAATLALHTGYATNAAVLLLVMASPDHPGWWATLVVVIGLTARAVVVARGALRRR